MYTTGLLSLQDVAGLPHEVIVQRITEALSKLDDAVRDIRDHVFAGQRQRRQPDAFTWQPPEIFEQQLGQTLQRSVFLRQRLAEAERALHASAARTAALMVQRASLLKNHIASTTPPGSNAGGSSLTRPSRWLNVWRTTSALMPEACFTPGPYR